MEEKGLQNNFKSVRKSAVDATYSDLVLDKSIFSDVFEKDIRRVYLYKKSERIGKALHLLLPAFRESKVLRERAEKISMALIDASMLPPPEAREAVSRELLALSSVIAMAKAGGRLSQMNADIILREAHNLLDEIASYEEPRLSLSETPTLATLSRTLSRTNVGKNNVHNDLKDSVSKNKNVQSSSNGSSAGQVKKNGRKDAILSILSNKGSVYIKDLSTMIRDVSEKTIQRELQSLVLQGKVRREGERRWTRYTLI